MLRRVAWINLRAVVVVTLALATMLLVAAALGGKFSDRTASQASAGVANPIALLVSFHKGCLDRGGTVSLRSSGLTFCRIAFPDGGRACTDTSECIGGCVVNAVRLNHSVVGAAGVCRSSNADEECLTPVVNGTAAIAASCALF